MFVTINRATSGSLHCCLLMENPPGIRIINNTVTNVLHHYHCIVICLLELSVASNLLSVCIHTATVDFFRWYFVLVFTVELVRIFATIN